jgi:hypothetical protein
MQWCRGVNRTAMTCKSSERWLTVTVAARVQSGGSKEIEGMYSGEVALNLTPEFVRLKHGEIAVETRLLRAHDLQARTLHLW